MPTWVFELHYRHPSDLTSEAELTSVVSSFGGWLDYRDAPEADGSSSVCLIYEFSDAAAAERVAE